MSDSKVFMFPDNFGGAGANPSAVDPNLLLAMQNGGFGGNGNWIWMFFLFLLYGRNGWGWNGGDNGAAGVANNDAGRELLMQAINGNREAIGQLSTMLNCKFDDVNAAICGLGSKIDQVGAQVGMSSVQVINAVQSGNAQLGYQLAQCCCELKTQLASCCCDIKESIATTNANLTRGFADVGYAFRDQTCNIEKAIQASTNQILEGQRAAEMREMRDKLDMLREKNSQQAVVINNAQQTATFGQMITQATQPIYAAVNGLQSDVDKIKCKLPETVTLPYSCATAVPTQAVIGYNGFGFGGWNFGGNGCCGGSLWG